MKKILIIMITVFGILSVHAGDFEGIISQSYFDGDKNFTVKMDWYIKGDAVTMKMTADGEVSTFIMKANKLTILSDRQVTIDGTPYFFEMKSSDIEQNIANLDYVKLLDKTIGKTENKEVENYSFVGGIQGNLTIFPITIDIDLASFFKDSYELQIMMLNEWNGFPISSVIKDKSGAVLSILETTSIESKELDNTIFEIPENTVNINSLAE